MNSQAPPKTFILRIRVHLLHPRYHGTPEWPPSPLRLFQALVAGAGYRCSLTTDVLEALEWLEAQPAPTIRFPECSLGESATFYVPNNDSDSIDFDDRKMGEIRAEKHVQIRHLHGTPTFEFHWRVSAKDVGMAEKICSISKWAFQFGRSVDPAWLCSRLLSTQQFEAEQRLRDGRLMTPCKEPSSQPLDMPAQGTLEQLRRRHEAAKSRFVLTNVGGSLHRGFENLPLVHARQQNYRSDFHAHGFAIKHADAALRQLDSASLSNVDVPQIVSAIRSELSSLLQEEFPERVQEIKQSLESTITVGLLRREQLGLQVFALPSVGHEHADNRVRRVVVRMPRCFPFDAQLLLWAMAKIRIFEDKYRFDPDPNPTMIDRYFGSMRPSTLWQTATPVAVTTPFGRRRLDAYSDDASKRTKGYPERAKEEANARAALLEELSNQGLDPRTLQIHVQREPFGRHGAKAQNFAVPPKVLKENLWHVQLELASPRSGPTLLGVGQHLGLGLFHPVTRETRHLAFSVRQVHGDLHHRPERIADALRRASMSLIARQRRSKQAIPSMVSGHTSSGAPTQSTPRVHFLYDPRRHRVLAILNVGTLNAKGRRDFLDFQRALRALRELRVDSSCRMLLAPQPILDRDPLFRRARVWKSMTPYVLNRHRQVGDLHRAIREDVMVACHDQKFPAPTDVRILRTWRKPSVGVSCSLELSFAVAIQGPVMLGRTRFTGGGVFEATT